MITKKSQKIANFHSFDKNTFLTKLFCHVGHCGSSQGNHGNKAGDGNGDIDPFDCDSNLFIIDGDNDGLGNYFEEEEDILMEEMDEQYDEEYYYRSDDSFSTGRAGSTLF